MNNVSWVQFSLQLHGTSSFNLSMQFSRLSEWDWHSLSLFFSQSKPSLIHDICLETESKCKKIVKCIKLLAGRFIFVIANIITILWILLCNNQSCHLCGFWQLKMFVKLGPLQYSHSAEWDIDLPLWKSNCNWKTRIIQNLTKLQIGLC